MLSMFQQLFVRHYLGEANGNGTEAARLAGYSAPSVAASRLLSLVKVQHAIKDHVDRVAMSSDEVLGRLTLIARSDAGDFLTFDPDKSPDEPPKIDLRRARKRGKLGTIKKLKQTTRTVSRGPEREPDVIREVEVEFRDPMPALVQLAKFHSIGEGNRDDTITLADVVRGLTQANESYDPDRPD